jgi:hypothetical protein
MAPSWVRFVVPLGLIVGMLGLKMLQQPFSAPTLSVTSAIASEPKRHTAALSPLVDLPPRPAAPRRMAWSSINITAAYDYFTREELDAIGFDGEHYHEEDVRKDASRLFGRTPQCSEATPRSCCLGATSAGGQMDWVVHQNMCHPSRTHYFQRYHPAAVDPWSQDNPSWPDRVYTMRDVIGRLGNRSLVFMGDSVMFQVTTSDARSLEPPWVITRPMSTAEGSPPKHCSLVCQVAGGAECSWLRPASFASLQPCRANTTDNTTFKTVSTDSKLLATEPGHGVEGWQYDSEIKTWRVQSEDVLSTVRFFRMYRCVKGIVSSKSSVTLGSPGCLPSANCEG